MRFLSFGRLFKNRAKNQNPKRKRKAASRQLFVEPLEPRVLLTNDSPTITAVIAVMPPPGNVVVNPLDGKTVSGTPAQLEVTYSEPMVSAQITTKANYLLFGSDGTSVSIDNVALDAVTPNTVDISFNGGQPLVADTYTLFVKGDQVHDTDDNLPVALPGELVVANGAISKIPSAQPSPATVSFVNVDGGGTLGAVGNYPDPLLDPNANPVTPNPTAVAFGDLSGATDAAGHAIPDLVVVGNATVSIFKGQAGGGFNLTPDAVLQLPAAATTPKLTSVVIGNFVARDNRPDIVVLDQANNVVTIYLNQRNSPGSLSFDNGTDFIAGIAIPVSSKLVAGDFDNDGNLDLAVADTHPYPTTKVGVTASKSNDWDINVLLGDGTGKFDQQNTPVNTPYHVRVGGVDVFPIGTKTSTTKFDGILVPSNLAVGQLDSDPRPDLVVTGNDGAFNSGGLAVLHNVSSPGIPSFSETNLNDVSHVGTGTSLANYSAAAVANMNGVTTGGKTGDVIAANLKANTIEVWGGPAFTGVSASVKVNTGVPDLAVQDFTGMGAPSILYVNKPFLGNSGVLGVVPNLTSAGSFALAATPTLYNVDGAPIGLAVTPPVTSADQVGVNGVNINQNPSQGDTNQDSFADVVTANSFDVATKTGNDITLLLGNGDGTLRISNDVPLKLGSTNTNPDPVASAVGDLNGDGIPDVVVVDQNTNKVSVFLSTGLDSTGRPLYNYGSVTLNPPVISPTGGTLAAGTYYYVVTAITSTGAETPPSNERSATTAGTTSKVTLSWTPFPGATGYNVYRGTSAGQENTLIAAITPGSTTTFTDTGTETTSPATPPPPPLEIPVGLSSPPAVKPASPIAVAIADLDNDGHNDIIVVNQGQNSLTILWGDGKGHFTPQNFSLGPTTTANPTGLVVGDFNHDGLLDIAVSHNGNLSGATERGVTVLLNLGSRLFDVPKEYASGTHASAIVAADFNQDGNLDLAVTNNIAAGTVVILRGQGDGTFVNVGTFPTVDSPNSLAVADFNRDGFPDLVVTSSNDTPSVLGNLGVLLNTFGNGFAPSVGTNILNGAGLRRVAVTDLNNDAYPDIVVSVAEEVDPLTNLPRQSVNNLFSLTSNGDGTFGLPIPYLAGGPPINLPEPSAVGLLSDALVRLATFTIQTTLVRTNLVRNGNFNRADLTGERGNLSGWQTLDQSGSAGRWSVQKGSSSPLSGTPETAPLTGVFAGMLDQARLFPTDPLFLNGTVNPTPPPPRLNDHPEPSSDFAGSHAMYQTLVIPNGTNLLTVSLNLLLDNFNTSGWSDTGSQPRLDYTVGDTTGANQQVRVDIIDANANAGPDGLMDVGANGGQSVAENLFITTQGVTPNSVSYFNISANLSNLLQTGALTVNQLGQRIIRLRIAAANNRGLLIVGVSNVKLVATYTDTKSPILSGLHLRNPGFGASPSFSGTSTDPSIVGQVNDDGLSPADALTPALGAPNNITKVVFDTANDGDFNGPDDYALNNWDPMGNFSITLKQLGDFLGQVPQLLPGTYTIGVQAIDKAGNTFTTQVQFTYQGPSTSAFAAQQGATDIQGVDPTVKYPTISGWITSIVADPRDQEGNTYYAGSRNGGVWKTTDGGNDWTPVTNFVTDAQGNPVPTAIGSLAMFVPNLNSPSAVIYAGTGVADNLPDSRPGIGILKSTDNGNSWTVVGQSVFTGARISKMAVSTFTDPVTHVTTNYVYAAVASGGQFGPGVYRSTDGGVTWTDVLDPTKMTIAASAGGGTVKSNGLLVSFNGQLLLPSVTDLTVDPFNPEDVAIGIGNIGLSPVNVDKTGKFLGDAGGLWKSTDFGNDWTQVVGNSQNYPLDSIPHGFDKTASSNIKLGRITLAEGISRSADEGFLYAVLTSAPTFDFLPTSTAPPVYSQGQIQAGTSFVENTGTLATPLGLYKSRDLGGDWTHVGLTQGGKNLSLFGFQASIGGALVVDPLNANVVYIGGRTGQEINTSPVPEHGFLRVDTRNIADTTFPNANNPTPNNGMDITNPAIGAYWIDLSNTANRGTATTPSSFKSGLARFVPDAINALTFDSQGRLLVGTPQGIWRGVGYGFSNGTGASATAKGMNFTDLNGNLQIADLTSVALDPTNPNILYTSSFYGGTAATSGIPGSLTFNSFGNLTSLTSVTGSDVIPSFIRTGPANPSAAPGTPTTIYRTWAFTSPNANGGITVEVYNSGTGLFQSIAAGHGINTTSDQAGLFPPLAVSPLSNQEVAFGTQRLYETDTGGNVWDSGASLGGTLMTDSAASLAKGGQRIFLSALAFAPSVPDVLYAGTEDGKLLNNLSGLVPAAPVNSIGFVTAAGFLPPRINGITVDPRDPTAQTAYVMVGSTAGVTVAGKAAGHVWRTTNGGATWTDISSNLPSTVTAAYSMVIDPRFGQVKMYLGTEVGVYISTNGGASWARLGQVLVSINGQNVVAQTLPFVPVVDLQFNQATETIAAATLGQGAFTISTNIIGPAVVSLSPNTPQIPAVTNATVGFNEPIDPRSLSIVQDATARENIVDLIDHSSEFRTDLVNGWYATFLNRQPGPGEAAIWVNQLATGSSQEQVIANILSSPEYFNSPLKGKGDNTDWIKSIYQDLVGRQPTTAELNQALSDFGHGATTAQVALADVLTQGTYRTALVTGFFIKYLKRLPGQEEINRYVHLILFGATTEQVLDKVIGSPEYYLKNGTTTLVGNISPTPPSPPVTNATELAQQLLMQNSKPSAVALADLNGDGIPDLIVANGVTDPASSFKDTVTIFLGKSGGTFNPVPIIMALPAGAAPTALTVADLNNDGKMDIAVANTGLPNSASNNSVSVFVNNSTTTTLSAANFTRKDFNGGDNPDSIVAADFNGATDTNGKPILDLAVADGKPDQNGQNDVTLLMGTGTAALFAVPITINTGLSSPASGLAAGLLDNDNKPDLAVSSTAGVIALLNDATGVFTNIQNALTTPVILTTIPTTSVAIGPIDSNSTPDVVATTPLNGGLVLVYQNSGGSSPTFSGPSVAPPVQNTPTTSGTGGSLAANTYFYVITATLSTGETMASNEQSVTTVGTTSTVTLSWTQFPPTATGYRIYRGTTSGNENTLIATIPVASTTTFTDTGSEATSTATPPTSQPPLPPGTPGAFAAGGNPVGVTLRDINGDKRNDILVVNAVFPGTMTVLKNTTVTGIPPVQNAPGTSTTGGSLAANTYFYVITATTFTGETTVSNEQSITTTGATSTVSLSWTQSPPGATGYKIYRGTSPGVENTLIASIPVPSGGTANFTDTGNEATVAASPPVESFTPLVSYPVGNKPTGLALADVNQDGILDVATANSSTNDVSLLTGIDDGSYQMPTDQSWINQSFVDLLQRPADATAFSIFFPALEQQEVVRLVGPRGTTVPLSVTPDPTSNNQLFNLTFAPQVMDGTYTLVIAPNTRGAAGDVRDFPGNPQNQNRNLLNGEIPADSFSGQVAVNTSDNGKFVTGLYHDLLGRVADTPGFLFFLGPLDAVRAQELGAIATSFASSGENYANFIRRLYSKADPGATGNYMLPIGNLLLRTAGQAEVNNWVQFLQGGGTEEQIIAGLIGSDEYFTNAAKGNSNTDTWLHFAYEDILGRDATDAQALIFKNQLQTNNTAAFRSQIAAFLLGSDEYRTRVIQATDLAFFGRVAGPGDLSSGLAIMRQPPAGVGQPTPDAQFVIGILGSQEYFYRVGNTNATWLTSLFTGLLGRPADVGGFTFWSNILFNSYAGQRLGAATLIDTSTEYRDRLVTGYFQTYLHRPPSAGELNQFVSFIQQGFTDEQIIAILVGSDEYFTRASHDNGQFLTNAYLDLLHRDRLNDPGAGFFLNGLNNGTLSRQQVASFLLNSVEYKRDLIASFFNTYLGRNKAIPTPPDGEVDAWATLLIQGVRDEQVIADLLSSPEYFNLPHLYP